MKACAAFLTSLGLGLGCLSGANAQGPTVPSMTIKIFNDDPNNHIYPVLTTGQGAPDIWLQAFFKIPQAQVPNHPYPRTRSFRIYINPAMGGIAPGQSVTLTIPLYTQLVSSVDPTQPNQYIDWWNGGTILIYSSDTATPPKALTDALTNRPSQKPVTQVFTGLPTCSGTACQPLQFFSDDSDLPKADPSQLTEYTLGARIALPVNNPNTDPPNDLDLANVDFDVSYVNVAYLPAAMGPFQNDQVGYVGTPQDIDQFKGALNKFLNDFAGWPRFARTYSDGTTETPLKLPSPLELFARLSSPIAPPDLEPAPNWPTQLWAPIEALRTNWRQYSQSCQPSLNRDAKGQPDMRGRGRRIGDAPMRRHRLAGPDRTGLLGFCDAIFDVNRLMMDNYANYRKIFPTQCNGTPIELTESVMLSHVYGWAPFTEAASGTGCGPMANLLENTPGYNENNFAEYLRIKEEFDNLNYGNYTDAPYVFNPWVVLIHNQRYVNAPNVYAYSVDDAVGNIQAEATGFIIDVGSTKNLENQQPASPPISISIGFGGPQPIQFTHYRVCQNEPSREKPINPNFASFIISANNPAKCPIFFRDNKSVPQFYTFTIVQAPPFTLFENPADAKWDATTTARWIDCTGNTTQAPFQQSSQAWCCNLTAQTGVWAYSTPEPHNAHQSLNHFVITNIPAQSITTSDTACSMGRAGPAADRDRPGVRRRENSQDGVGGRPRQM
jgi:hypothetical protein